jgi:hypothetical protein
MPCKLVKVYDISEEVAVENFGVYDIQKMFFFFLGGGGGGQNPKIKALPSIES